MLKIDRNVETVQWNVCTDTGNPEKIIIKHCAKLKVLLLIWVGWRCDNTNIVSFQSVEM